MITISHGAGISTRRKSRFGGLRGRGRADEGGPPAACALKSYRNFSPMIF